MVCGYCGKIHWPPCDWMTAILVRPTYQKELAAGGQRPRIHGYGRASKTWCRACRSVGRDPFIPLDAPCEHYRPVAKRGSAPTFPMVAWNLGDTPVVVRSAVHYKRECAARGKLCLGL